MAVRASDKNRAKTAFYNMYNQAVKNKLINKDEIVEEVSSQAPTYQTVVTKKRQRI